MKIVASDKVYVADMLQRLSTTEFATQEGTLYPLVEQDAARRHGRLRLAGVGRRAAAQVLQADRERESRSSTSLTDYWAYINQTLDNLGQG